MYNALVAGGAWMGESAHWQERRSDRWRRERGRDTYQSQAGVCVLKAVLSTVDALLGTL